MKLPVVQYERILFATDLSKAASIAFAHAVSLAVRYGATITVFHVMEENPAPDAMISARIGAEQWQDLKNRAEAEAKECLTEERPDNAVMKEVLSRICEVVRTDLRVPDTINIENRVERGNPCEQILKCAREKNCDLIVIGRHGHSRLADLLLGSKARDLMLQSDIPVLIVGLPEDE